VGDRKLLALADFGEVGPLELPFTKGETSQGGAAAFLCGHTYAALVHLALVHLALVHLALGLGGLVGAQGTGGDDRDRGARGRGDGHDRLLEERRVRGRHDRVPSPEHTRLATEIQSWLRFAYVFENWYP
jgi:hypothetical protein